MILNLYDQFSEWLSSLDSDEETQYTAEYFEDMAYEQMDDCRSMLFELIEKCEDQARLISTMKFQLQQKRKAESVHLVDSIMFLLDTSNASVITQVTWKDGGCSHSLPVPIDEFDAETSINECLAAQLVGGHDALKLIHSCYCGT